MPVAGMAVWYGIGSRFVSCAFGVGCSDCSSMGGAQGVVRRFLSRVRPVVIVILVIVLVGDWYVVVVPNSVCS